MKTLMLIYLIILTKFNTTFKIFVEDIDDKKEKTGRRNQFQEGN